MMLDKFKLHAVVDIFDDFMYCYFTEKTLREMMRLFREWGVSRVIWNGQSYASGLYDGAAEPMAKENAKRTFDEIGEFIPAAVKAAHDEGMEIFSQFKPLDQYFPGTVPHGIDTFKNGRKGIRTLGGSWQFGTVFPEKHPELLMSRNNQGLREGIENEKIGMIKLVKNDSLPTRISGDNLKIYVSNDNLKFTRYGKPVHYVDQVEERPEVVKGINVNSLGMQRERVRTITLSGLDIDEMYIALSVQDKEGDPDFANRLYKLVEVYNDRNQLIPVTCSIPRAETDIWHIPELRDKKFPDRGFMFDFGGDMCKIGFNLIDETVFLDAREKTIGIARGKNPYISALCPACPEVQEYWLEQVREFIRDGVDGVEMRWASHQNSIDMEAYGFNKPVVDEYEKLYGVNILKGEFDKTKWRQLLGQHYTHFYRQSRELLKQNGRKFAVDIMSNNEIDASKPQFLNIHLDYRQWFSFADEAIFKWVGPEQMEKFKQDADVYNLPIFYCAWPQVIFKGKDKRQITDDLERMVASGFSGFRLYEAAGLMRAHEDGSFELFDPAMIEAIASFIKSQN
jgi:hypothetical protein